MKIPLKLLTRVAPRMTYDLIRRQLGGSVPFAKHVGVELVAIEKGRARAHLPSREQGMNHIGSQHAGALFALGETASGGAMAGAFASMLLEIRPVAADASIRYLAVAHGPIRAEAAIGGDVDGLLAGIMSDGKVRFPVEIAMFDESGTRVAEMTVSWHVSMKRAKAA